MRKNITITWANEKGGVGKTTWTVTVSILSLTSASSTARVCKLIRCLMRSSRLRLIVCSNRLSY